MAAWANYTWEAFCELGGEQMSAHVAAYRTEKQIEAVLAAWQAKHMKQSSQESAKE